MVRPEHHSLSRAHVDGGLQRRGSIAYGVEVDVFFEHVPDRALWPRRGGISKGALVVNAGLDPAREEGEGAAGVGEEDLESGVPVEDPGEVGARDGDGGFEGEAEGEGEDVA